MPQFNNKNQPELSGILSPKSKVLGLSPSTFNLIRGFVLTSVFTLLTPACDEYVIPINKAKSTARKPDSDVQSDTDVADMSVTVLDAAVVDLDDGFDQGPDEGFDVDIDAGVDADIDAGMPVADMDIMELADAAVVDIDAGPDQDVDEEID